MTKTFTYWTKNHSDKDSIDLKVYVHKPHYAPEVHYTTKKVPQNVYDAFLKSGEKVIAIRQSCEKPLPNQENWEDFELPNDVNKYFFETPREIPETSSLDGGWYDRKGRGDRWED